MQENAVQNWMSSADEHVAQEVVECLREIENVYFYDGGRVESVYGIVGTDFRQI